MILAGHEVLENIIRHSLTVERVAIFLAGRLSSIGNVIDTELLSAGALLHDIAKMRGIAEGRPHGELGAAVAEGLGLDEVAPLIRQHVRLDDYADNGRIDEARLVNYADKRVNHVGIVTLDERFAYLYERYGRVSEGAMERLIEMRRLTGLLETQIFAGLSIDPQDIERLIGEEGSGLHSR